MIYGGSDHVARDHEHREDADRNVDVERPSPGISVGEPSAKRRPQHRRDHHAQAEDGHGQPALLRRKSFQQDGLRERLQRSSARALHRARNQNPRQAGRRAAGERRNREDDDAGDEKSFSPEAQRKPRTGRQNNGIGHQVAGEHPGSFVIGGRQAAGNVRQRDGGDGSVEHLHERRQHDRDRDQPGIAARDGAARCRLRCHLFLPKLSPPKACKDARVGREVSMLFELGAASD